MEPLLAPDLVRVGTQFRRFYGELVSAQRLAETGDSGASDGIVVAVGDRDAETVARTIFARLHRVLGELGYGAYRIGRPTALDIDVGYIMAALADETLLHRVKWPGRDRWQSMLLEDALYGSRIAGERIFEAAEELAHGSSVFRSDIALAILLTLQLGFRGRYRGINDEGAPARLRSRLYELLCHRPWNETLEWRTSFAAAYQPTLGEDHAAGLPRLRPWLAAIAVTVCGFLLVNHMIWRNATHDIVERASQVVEEGAKIEGWGD
ncbi:MAG: DotU family type IV/VI secretion system protein [Rhodospirillales bacterium]|nr:DotU family type IV/VI secretion system protein [Rhodospirillales bacterium]